MANPTHYPDKYTRRRRSFLPTSAQDAVFALGDAVSRRDETQALTETYRQSMAALPARTVSRALIEIRDIGQLHEHPSDLPVRGLLMFKTGRVTPLTKLLANSPDLGWLMIFHGNGHVRQATLDRLQSLPISAFELTALVYKLNDWVGIVRASASQYARRSFPDIPPRIVAESCFYLLLQSHHFSRWGDNEKQIFRDMVYRPDVLEHLKTALLGRQTGSAIGVLRQVMQQPDFDLHLPGLAMNATLAPVRAITTEALLARRAKWFDRYETEWVDKVFSLKRRVARYETRVISHDMDISDLLAKAVTDRSTMVRNVAADHLIAHGAETRSETERLAKLLLADKRSSVVGRAKFCLKKLQSEDVEE